ncbi:amino acid permease [Corynebacterium pseudotuberculosis]|uniref:amino acid permease n=1 Tax=Corynebacterium pseudotuberculosis TaxID=1719 RepID=UPI0001DD8434|nr:amino acid permease [Corynebacterium pseudotuberculosis]ADK28571.1 amino acid permease [Corynebacterium pseudotuberculosis FRC41]AEX39254.1 Aromatic amino acid transport protein [Corynebacterium pseudotuberculosis 3/99-5]ALU20243.1 amino acid transporter [Corynebacterium pseudotuberculosis]AUZ43739.1 Aromatic amino acid transport protein [Corynebacterium pseudotuberculosis]MEA1026454.1 amino acid permease [Corynebacterium pseudotuberculosis]
MTEATSETGLGSGLKTRHLTMMGLGSAIGAGLFLGTGVGIAAAGPAVLIAYIISGIFVVFVMQMLGELAAARPASGSFSIYAEQAFGRWAGFSLGWLYWFMLTMVLGAEMTGAAAIMGQWFGIDPWIPALVCVVFFAVINFAQVGGFGEFEFWFAFIKVAVIIVFLIIGVLLIFGLLPGHDYVGTRHFLGDGFMPNGITGVATGLLAVAFAFGGTEIVTIAAAESEDPKTAIATAVRSVIWRISTFYLGSVLVISFLLPHSQIGGAKTAAQSPFTIILGMANIPGVVGFMEAIIVVALLSAFNAQIYATSRFVHSMAQRGNAPRMFASTNRGGVPIAAVILSMVFAFASVGLQYWNPAGLLSFLLNAVGGCLIVIWSMISLSYIKLHPELVKNGEITTVRMWCYPWLAWFTVAGFVGLTLLMLSDDSSRSQITSVTVVFTVLIILSFLTRKKSK